MLDRFNTGPACGLGATEGVLCSRGIGAIMGIVCDQELNSLVRFINYTENEKKGSMRNRVE